MRVLIGRAVANQRPDARWRSSGSGNAHFIPDAAGMRLVAINAEAEAILMASHLLRQQVSMTHPPGTAPGFARCSPEPAPCAHVPVADGRIAARASRTRAVDTGLGPLMHVALDRQMAVDVLMIEAVMQLPLTPLVATQAMPLDS